MKRILSQLLALAFVLSLSSQALAEEIEIQSGVFGGTLYQMSYAFTEILKANAPDIKATAVETSGTGMGIVKAASAPERRIVAGTLVPFLEARSGVPPYKKAYSGLRVIGNLSENIQTLITFDSSVKTIGDLKGKRIGLGPKPTVLGRNHAAIVSKAMASAGKPEFFYMTWGTMRDGILDGSLDAMILGVSTRPKPPFVPVAVYGEMVASRGNPTFISIPAAAVQQAAAEAKVAYEACVLPAGSIAEGVPAEDTGAWHDMLGLYAFDSFPEETAYTLAKVLYEHCQEMAKYSAAAKGVWKDLIVPQVPEAMIHPGALRFYKEKGLR